MNEEHIVAIAGELQLAPRQVHASAQLLADGATIPFIARYRKEVTGALEEPDIYAIRERLDHPEDQPSPQGTRDVSHPSQDDDAKGEDRVGKAHLRENDEIG